MSKRGEAVQIAYVSHNKLCFATSAFNGIMDKVGFHKVSVVSVNGPMRTGKSYILGYFLRYLTYNKDEEWFNKELEREFHWENSADRQTTGISMWSEPLFIGENKEKIAILLMDTQGCFDDQTSMHENSLICAFSCILSSVLVYNVSKQISEDVLQFLQLFVGYAKEAISFQTSNSFSKLVFLVRDWQFPKDFNFGYHDDSNAPGPKNYKKNKFDVHAEMPTEVEGTHEEILSSFDDVGCCLLPYPGDDLALNDINSNLNSSFINAVKDFIPRTLKPSNVVIKEIGGKNFNGENMKKLGEELAIIFACGEILPVQNVADSTAEVQNVIAYSDCMNYYKNIMDEELNSSDGIAEHELEEIHKMNMEKAMQLFEGKKCLKNETMERRYSKMLHREIQNALQYYKQSNSIKFNCRLMKIRAEKEKRDLEKQIQELRERNDNDDCVLL